MVGDGTGQKYGHITWGIVGREGYLRGSNFGRKGENFHFACVCSKCLDSDLSSWGRAKTNLTFGPMAGSQLVSFPSYITPGDSDKNNMVPIT